MNGFSSYWREISLIVAGVTAIAGVLFEVKDSEKKITKYGRLFFLVTFLSLVCGLYAQWQTDSAEAKRSTEAQVEAADAQKRSEATEQNILTLLKKTDAAIASIERARRPIQTFAVKVRIRMRCNEIVFKKLCSDNVKPDWRNEPGLVFFGEPKGASLPWIKGQTGDLVPNIRLQVFKNREKAEKFFAENAATTQHSKLTSYDDALRSFSLARALHDIRSQNIVKPWLSGEELDSWNQIGQFKGDLELSLDWSRGQFNGSAQGTYNAYVDAIDIDGRWDDLRPEFVSDEILSNTDVFTGFLVAQFDEAFFRTGIWYQIISIELKPLEGPAMFVLDFKTFEMKGGFGIIYTHKFTSDDLKPQNVFDRDIERFRHRQG